MSVIPGARKKRKRVGRGVGSGMGKTASHGHQFSLSTPREFEGGQTTLWKRIPKSGFNNVNERDMSYVNLGKIQQFIDQKRLLPAVFHGENQQTNYLVTMRDLLHAGLISSIKDGVKILADDKDMLKTPIHLEVSMASGNAVQAVEAVGGSVTCVHFNTLALRALTKPYKFTVLPLRARPNPKIIDYYLDKEKCGYLSPEIQLRNLSLFDGRITSEERYRREHDLFMAQKRVELKKAKALMMDVQQDA